MKQKDIVLITIDCARYDRLSWNGYQRVFHENMEDLLGNYGVVFENCFVQSVATPPSHASLLTGEYPSVHGIRSMYNCGLHDNVKTMPELLREQGYWTGAWVGFNGLCSEYGLDRGFDYVDEDSDLSKSWGKNGQGGAKGNDWRYDLNWFKFPDKPRFAWFHYFFSHTGSDRAIPAGYEQFRDESLDPLYQMYDAKIKWFDQEWLPVIMDKFPPETTRYIITADHGECFDHSREVAHGRQMFRDTLHVPMMVTNVRRGSVAPEYTEARSILPMLVTPEKRYYNDICYAEIHRKIGGEDEFYRWTVFNPYWKFILRSQTPQDEPEIEYVYNTHEDPYEMRNLADGPVSEWREVWQMWCGKLDAVHAYQRMPAGQTRTSYALRKQLENLGYM